MSAKSLSINTWPHVVELSLSTHSLMPCPLSPLVSAAEIYRSADPTTLRHFLESCGLYDHRRSLQDNLAAALNGPLDCRSLGVAADVYRLRKLRAEWFQLIPTIDLTTPPNKGALWSALDGVKDAKSIAEREKEATSLAIQDGRITLGMKLPQAVWDRYQRDFPRRTDLSDELTSAIWFELSSRFAAGLRGQVTAYVRNSKMYDNILKADSKNADNHTESRFTKNQPILPHELMVLAEDMLEENASCTVVRMKCVATGREWIMDRGSVSRAARLNH